MSLLRSVVAACWVALPVLAIPKGGGGHAHHQKAAASAGAFDGAGGSGGGAAAGVGIHRFKEFAIAWPEVHKFDSTDHSHSWCQIEHDIHTGKVPFKDALRGYNVSIAFPLMPPNHPTGVVYNRSRGVIEGGYGAEVLEEVARVAGFHWHHTAAVVEWIDREAGESDDEWLRWAVNKFDLVDVFMITRKRLSTGIRFAYPYVDASSHLVGRIAVQTPPFYATLLSMFKPFDLSLWLLILGSFGFSAVIYLSLERGRDDIPAGTHSGFGQSLWLTMVSFTGGGGFAPQTMPGKVFVLSWTFLVLLLTTGYTANLATEMIIKNAKSAVITGIDDALARSLPICVEQNSAHEQFLKFRYPALPLKFVYSRRHKYDAVRNGECVAACVAAYEWEFASHMDVYNADCSLGAIGRNFLKTEGSFAATAADPWKCSGVVIDVITSVMHEMYIAGYFERVKERYIQRYADKTCPTMLETDGEASTHLAAKDMLGAFGMHVAISVLCVVLAVFLRHGTDYDAADEGSGDDEEDEEPEDSNDCRALTVRGR